MIVGTRTSTRISAASLPRLGKKPGLHADGHGLYLHVISQSSRSWAFRYMLNRRARTMGLGSAELVDLATARRLAMEYRKLLQQGIDPLEHRQSQLQLVQDEQSQKELDEAALRKRTRSFGQCVEEFLEKHSKKWRSKKHAAQWKSTLDQYASIKFGSKDVATLGSEDLIDALKASWTKKAETASRTLQRIVKVLVWAQAMGYRGPVDPRLAEVVALGLGPHKKRIRGHMAACRYDQVYEILRLVDGSTAMFHVKLAFEFTVLTAARSGETRGARWSELKLEEKIWSIPAGRMKSNVAHEVPLSERAITLLKLAAPLGDKKPEALVFPGRNGQVLSDMVFTQLLRRLDVSCTMHGFRSTFRDWASEKTEYSSDVCEAALAHVRGNKVERAYHRTSLLEKRTSLMSAWADYVAVRQERTSLEKSSSGS